jgi:hypothetical protein
MVRLNWAAGTYTMYTEKHISAALLTTDGNKRQLMWTWVERSGVNVLHIHRRTYLYTGDMQFFGKWECQRSYLMQVCATSMATLTQHARIQKIIFLSCLIGQIPKCHIALCYSGFLITNSTCRCGLSQPLTEMSTRNVSCGIKTAGA